MAASGGVSSATMGRSSPRVAHTADIVVNANDVALRAASVWVGGRVTVLWIAALRPSPMNVEQTMVSRTPRETHPAEGAAEGNVDGGCCPSTRTAAQVGRAGPEERVLTVIKPAGLEHRGDRRSVWAGAPTRAEHVAVGIAPVWSIHPVNDRDSDGAEHRTPRHAKLRALAGTLLPPVAPGSAGPCRRSRLGPACSGCRNPGAACPGISARTGVSV